MPKTYALKYPFTSGKYSYGFSSTTAWMANVFRASPQGKVIRAVSFYTASPKTSYTVKIYDNCTTTGPLYSPVVHVLAGTLKCNISGMLATAGYHTVKLPSPVIVSVGTASQPANFSVVVKLTDSTGHKFPLPIQAQDAGYSGHSTVIMGQSYASATGAAGTWSDLASYDAAKQVYTGYKACLKAFGTAN